MSYQMSRIRGAEAYRLLITRATNLESLSAWLGVDKERLLEANPWLQTDELEQGQELLVMASYVHLQFPDSAFRQAEEASDGDDSAVDEEEVAEDAEADEIEDEAVPDGPEAVTETPMFSDTHSEVAETEEATQAPESTSQPDAAAEKQDGSQTKEVPARQQPEEAQRSVTWRPFPKSVL